MHNSSKSSAIQTVEELLHVAYQHQASDIHIEPLAADYRIRMRLHGVLQELKTVSIALGLQTISRLKLLANMNITEKRYPQDGRCTIALSNATPTSSINQQLNLRISTCPCMFGEKLTIRLLNDQRIKANIEQLGLNVHQKKLIYAQLKNSQGLIMVCGPTGSGKTFTLYSMLNFLNTVHRHIATIEDPVEIILPGITQINIAPQIDLTFANALRALLRHDPDIIMIGEIRDGETAKIAIHAAQTGHLVLCTIHASHLFDLYNRLLSFNIPSSHFISCLNLIIFQRLIRKYCECQTSKIYSCQQCVTQPGYHGRTGIYEVHALTESMRISILKTKNNSNFHTVLEKNLRQTLWQSGMEKVELGITNQKELTRTLTSPDDHQ